MTSGRLEKPLLSPQRRCGTACGTSSSAAVLAFAGLVLVAPGVLADRDPALSAPPSPVAQPSRPASAPLIYLTSHAPFGQPGASDRVTASCGDSSRKDTLYMCFDPGRDAEHFVGLKATVYFWAAGGESLGGHWKFGAGQDFRGLEVQFAPDSVPGTERAWPASNVARAGYSSTNASGKLMMIVAGAAGQGLPVKRGVLYVLARLLVPRPALKARGCDRPICIEWATAALAYGIGDLDEVNRGQRFVSWNSADGRICAPMSRFGAPQPWRPSGR